MNARLILLSLPIAGLCPEQAQGQPELDWQRCMGGSAEDFVRAVYGMPNGDVLVSGFVYSTDGDITGQHGDIDAWLVRLNSQGTVLWERALGGSADDHLHSTPTSDGGTLLTGETSSSDGDVTGAHGGQDGWVVKLDSAGIVEWQRALGGTSFDDLQWWQGMSTADGGYLLPGNSMSADGDLTANQGGTDLWLVKLNSAGVIEWQHTYGGSEHDLPGQCATPPPTADGGYVILGQTFSANGDVTGQHGVSDAWLIKVNAVGELLWQHALGGSDAEVPTAIRPTADGGYALLCSTLSTNGDVTGQHGLRDAWVVKVDSEGTLEWQRALGGSNDDVPIALEVDADGDLLVATLSRSSDGDVTGHHGGTNSDVWVVKLSSTGELLWERSLGGSSADEALSMVLTTGQGCVLAGSTLSTNGDVVGNHGQYDAWLLELDAEGDLLWQLPLGGTQYDWFWPLSIAVDGSYLMAGCTASNDGDVSGHQPGANYDYWVVKTKGAPTSIMDGGSVDGSMVAYPDPFTDELLIRSSYPASCAIIRLLEPSGREVWSGRSCDDPYRAALPSFGTGLYLVQLVMPDGTVRTVKAMHE